MFGSYTLVELSKERRPNAGSPLGELGDVCQRPRDRKGALLAEFRQTDHRGLTGRQHGGRQRHVKESTKTLLILGHPGPLSGLHSWQPARSGR
jgi:hypothetical protein